MPRQKRSSSQMRFAFIGELSVSNVLDWLIAILVVGIASFNIFQLGGVRAETMLLSIWMTAVLVFLHGLWVIASAKGKPIEISRYGLLMIPLLAYMLLHWLILSPVHWEAHRDMIILLQAFILFWVVLNNFGSRQQIWFILAAICVMGSFTILTAYNQYLRAPDWGPKLFSHFEGRSLRIKLDPAYFGRASGPLGSPSAFAGLMLLILFPALVATSSKRFALVIRILTGFITVMVISAIAISHSLSAIFAMSLCLLLCPLLLAYKPKARLFSFLGALATIGVVLASLFITSELFKERILALLAGETSDPSFPLWSAALKGFFAHPIFGQGMSSFGWYFEQHRPEGYNFDPLYAHSEYLNFLSDFGVVGVLLALPAAWLLFRADRVLKSQARFVMIEHPVKAKVAPAKRMFLGAISLSFIAFAIDSVFWFHLRVPALLFVCAIYFGIALKCLPLRPVALPKGKVGALSAVVGALLVALLLVSFSQSYLIARSYTVEGERRLDEASLKLIEREPLDLEDTEDTVLILEMATQLNPNDPVAWSYLAQARLDMRYIYPSQFATYGSEAEADIRKALAINDDNENDWTILGTALWMQGDYATSGEAFRYAVQLAPNNSSAWYHLAAYLNIDSDTREDALAAIDRALMLKPNDAATQDLRRKILIP